jgi:hypothetical protein
MLLFVPPGVLLSVCLVMLPLSGATIATYERLEAAATSWQPTSTLTGVEYVSNI